jgi:peptidoglycan/LPS O-acetylase OafA/YrhL
LAIQVEVPGHRDDIQALRGFAVLAVVAYHAGLPVHGGFIGVDIFFVISGFVITKLILGKYSEGSFKFNEFFEKRILRLVPLLTLVNIATVLFCLVAFSPFGEVQQVTEAMKYATFFGANYFFYSTNDYLNLAFHPLRHLWSLSAEEQFYLVFPFLLIGLMFVSRKINQRLTLVGIFVVGLVSFFFCLQASSNLESADHLRAAFFGTHLRAWEFLIGALAFCLLNQFGPMRSRLFAGMFSFLGFFMMLYGVLFISSTAGYPNIQDAVPVVGTALLIYGGSTPIGFSFLFSNPVLVWLGNVSYGWYLWHWPIVVFVQRALSPKAFVLVLASLFALLLAAFTSRFFENPIRYSSKLSGKKSWAVLVACMLVSLLAIGSVNKLASTGLGIGVESSGSELIALESCRGRSAVDNPENPCDNGVQDSDSLVVLLGDSQAQSAADGLFQAGVELGVRIIGFQADGCPMSARSTVKESEWCPDVQNAYVDSILRFNPDVVVIVNRYDQYVVEGSDNGPNDLRVPFSDGNLPTNREEQLQSVVESLSEKVTAVRNLGPKVIAMLETPTVLLPEPNLLSKMFKSVRSAELNQVLEWNKVRDEIASEIRTKLSGIVGVQIVDPSSNLCGEYPKCSAVSGGLITHWEKQHLNRIGSLQLTQFWKSTIGPLVGVSGD